MSGSDMACGCGHEALVDLDASVLPGYRWVIEGEYERVFAHVTPDAVNQEARVLAPFLDRVLAALAPRPDARLLDVGCGSGAFALSGAWARRGAHVTGLDASERAVRVAADAARVAGLENVAFTQRDAEDPPAGPFDGVTVLSVFNLVADKPAALHAWRRVAAPGARLVVTDGFRDTGASTRGAGAMTLTDFTALAADAGWRVTATEDLTDLVRALNAEHEWPWTTYVRDGFRYALVALDAA